MFRISKTAVQPRKRSRRELDGALSVAETALKSIVQRLEVIERGYLDMLTKADAMEASRVAAVAALTDISAVKSDVISMIAHPMITVEQQDPAPAEWMLPNFDSTAAPEEGDGDAEGGFSPRPEASPETRVQ